MILDNKISTLTPIIRGLVNDLLNSSGRDVFKYEGDPKFRLSKDFIDSTTIQVCLNGTALANQDLQFNSSKNRIDIAIITSGLALALNDSVIITYGFHQKFSDLEIKQYIQSSLAYFVEHRYKKVFCINSTDCIIAINNISPTIRELYFICMISSILLDPQNVRIRTDEFTITPNRNNSDRDQISEAFAKYQTYVGSVDNILKDHTGH